MLEKQDWLQRQVTCVGDFQTLTRKSLTLHSSPFAPLPLPRIARAPSLRLALNRSRARANASFTNSLLPITAPSVKYLTRQCNIFANPRSFKTVPLSLLSNISAVFSVFWPTRFPTPATSARPGLRPKASPEWR